MRRRASAPCASRSSACASSSARRSPRGHARLRRPPGGRRPRRRSIPSSSPFTARPRWRAAGARHGRARLAALAARGLLRLRGERSRDDHGGGTGDRGRAELRRHRDAPDQPHHQAEGPELRPAVDARRLRRPFRRRGSTRSRPAARRARRLRGGPGLARLRPGAARHPQRRQRLAGDAVRTGIRCPLPRHPAVAGAPRATAAARRHLEIISAARRWSRPAAGTVTTSPRTPISASACPASATGSAPSPRRPPRSRPRAFSTGATSARAGSKAGARRGWCTCAIRGSPAASSAPAPS